MERDYGEQKMIKISIGIREGMRNYIHLNEWDVIMHPCPKFSSS